MDDYTIGVLTNMGLFSFLALSGYLLLIAGELSFGQQAFFGIGAYASGIATAMYGAPLWLALPFAMLLGAAAAFLVGLPTLRLRGLYFAMATLAAAEMIRILFELLHFQRMLWPSVHRAFRFRPLRGQGLVLMRRLLSRRQLRADQALVGQASPDDVGRCAKEALGVGELAIVEP